MSETKTDEVTAVRTRHAVETVCAPGLCDACKRPAEELVCMRPVPQGEPLSLWSGWCVMCIEAAASKLRARSHAREPAPAPRAQSRPTVLAGLVMAKWHGWSLNDLDRIAARGLTHRELATLAAVEMTPDELAQWASNASLAWACTQRTEYNTPSTSEASIINGFGEQGMAMLCGLLLEASR